MTSPSKRRGSRASVVGNGRKLLDKFEGRITHAELDVVDAAWLDPRGEARGSRVGRRSAVWRRDVRGRQRENFFDQFACCVTRRRFVPGQFRGIVRDDRAGGVADRSFERAR